MKNKLLNNIIRWTAFFFVLFFYTPAFADNENPPAPESVISETEASDVIQPDTTQPDTTQTDAIQPNTIQLDAIVVTAGKRKEPVSDIPAHVTIIDSQDIQAAAGTSITDVLAREAGITIRSTFGNDKQAVVDLRGMGDTAASNVVVMVDGLVLNSPDQSGPSLSSIPLEQISRIEIVRGAGSVVYGSGAVGGVINIITKKAGDAPAAEVYSSYGSHKTYENRLSLDRRIKNAAVNLNAGWQDSDGYRDNGFFRKKDVTAKAGYDFTDRFSVNLYGAYYEDEYGLPGPVSREDIDSTSRRKKTNYPEDDGETQEAKARLELDIDLDKWGALSVKRGYLSRENRYIMGFSPQIPRSDQEDKIDEDTRQLDLSYVKYYSMGGMPQMIQMGLDHYETEYYRESRPDGPRENSETESTGVFINNQWAVFQDVKLNAGARYNHYKGRFRTDERKLFDDKKYWVNGAADSSDWDNPAYALGMTWALTPATSIFTSFATSFRIPNVDEFAECEDGLEPQEGRHMEIGARHWMGPFLSFTVSVFDIRIDDEIYYSDINRNYDDTTIRQGVEWDITVYPHDDLRLWGNYTYTDAEFDRQNTTVPLVPAHSASAGLHWRIVPALSLALSGTYTGSRYDGNDTDNNRYAKLEDYFVCSGKLSYEYKHFTVFAGVHNLFNELYETSGYSEQYYPMPEQTIYGGIRWTYF